MDTTQPQFIFSYYRFTTVNGTTVTKVVRDFSEADGMRTLIVKNQLQEASERVSTWASGKSITVNPQPLFPSAKHPGKMWLDFRFGGLAL